MNFRDYCLKYWLGEMLKVFSCLFVPQNTTFPSVEAQQRNKFKLWQCDDAFPVISHIPGFFTVALEFRWCPDMHWGCWCRAWRCPCWALCAALPVWASRSPWFHWRVMEGERWARVEPKLTHQPADVLCSHNHSKIPEVVLLFSHFVSRRCKLTSAPSSPYRAPPWMGCALRGRTVRSTAPRCLSTVPDPALDGASASGRRSSQVITAAASI